MNAAVVESFAKPPRYATFPRANRGRGEALVKVRAAALSNLVKGQASGSHYSSGSELPFVPGYDGVGNAAGWNGACISSDRERRLEQWRSGAWRRPAGQSCCPTRLTMWWRRRWAIRGWRRGERCWAARGCKPGESVLINGATGVAGQQAIQVAKHLGARRVVATGREEAVLARLLALWARTRRSRCGNRRRR
jgi:NADPH:quinone reductase-like Zn-dependent oxidoreductase